MYIIIFWYTDGGSPEVYFTHDVDEMATVLINKAQSAMNTSVFCAQNDGTAYLVAGKNISNLKENES